MCEFVSPASCVARIPKGIALGAAEVLDALMAGKRSAAIALGGCPNPWSSLVQRSTDVDGCLERAVAACAFYEGNQPSRLSLNRRASKGTCRELR